MDDFPHSALEEYKTQASILLKQLRSDDTAAAPKAALRFQQLPHFLNQSAIDIIKSRQVKLKHALTVIAQEHDFDSWVDFKRHLERKDKLAERRESYYTLLYPPQAARFVLEWHANYEIASTELSRSGGYLLPYKKQFFICEAEYIAELGLDPDDPDWELIGYNWIHPADQSAWERLDSKLRAISRH